MSRVLAQREPLRYEIAGGVDLMLREERVWVQAMLSTLNETIRALVERGILSDGCRVALA